MNKKVSKIFLISILTVLFGPVAIFVLWLNLTPGHYQIVRSDYCTCSIEYIQDKDNPPLPPRDPKSPTPMCFVSCGEGMVYNIKRFSTIVDFNK